MMLLKNVVYGLLLGFLCVSISSLFAGNKKAPLGPTQYRASSEQVFEFFSKQGLDFQSSWNEFKVSQIDLKELKQQISQSFNKFYNFLRQRNFFELVGSKEGNVFDCLVKCFGQCSPEHKWIKVITKNCLTTLSKQDLESARFQNKPFYKWQRCEEWADCYMTEAAKVILENIKEKIFSCLDIMQEYKEVPEFWVVVTSIKAGKEMKLLTECMCSPAQRALMAHCYQPEQTFGQSITADEGGDDHWEDVQQSASCPVKACMLAAGVAIVIYGILENYWL